LKEQFAGRLTLTMAFPWSGRRFESAYEAALKYFEVNKRLTLVNNRLNMIGELHSVLAEENASTHASQLEASVYGLFDES
jgi:uncharacterized Rmd1/YagE family protein